MIYITVPGAGGALGGDAGVFNLKHCLRLCVFFLYKVWKQLVCY